ncbi:NAD-dependent epimerase/dehydratase family protein, partial [Planktothrix sp. FACHB-1355]
MKVAITGATGFVGSRLVERLHESGDRVLVLTRNPERAKRVFPSSTFPNVEIVAYTPTESGEWQKSLSGCDGVVNLAGEPLAEGRWTPERKQAIMDSRKIGTQRIVEAISQANPKPTVLVST